MDFLPWLMGMAKHHQCSVLRTCSYLFALVGQTIAGASISSRFRMFGMLTGVLREAQYSPRACNCFLALVRALLPKFSAATMRVHKYGPVYATELTRSERAHCSCQ